MQSSNTLSPKILAILLIPVILLVSFLGALYFIQQPIPSKMDLQLEKLDGSVIQTSSLKGKTLIVEFFATWCTYCKEISENIAGILQKNSLSNMVFISVTIDPTHDTIDVLNKYVSDNNLTSNVGDQWIFARDLSEQYTYYAVSTVPHTFLVDNNSIIVDQKLGLITTNDILSWLQISKVI
jgi:cytochrome oxidase Cu insertion factor (SCO1/SenC/PrrC family)